MVGEETGVLQDSALVDQLLLAHRYIGKSLDDALQVSHRGTLFSLDGPTLARRCFDYQINIHQKKNRLYYNSVHLTAHQVIHGVVIDALDPLLQLLVPPHQGP